MAVTQYIGARYVPLFAEPLAWDITKAYEPLTIVYHQGNSYTSKQAVPAGIDLTNETYWAITGNYNAQIEQYRQEVSSVSTRMQNVEGSISDLEDSVSDLDTAIQSEATTRANAITAVQGDISDVETSVSTETTNRQNADAAIEAKIGGNYSASYTVADAIEEVAERTSSDVLLVFGDSWTSPHQDSISARDGASPWLASFPWDGYKFNFCDGGAGFAKTSSVVYQTNFAGQVALASASTDFDNEDVKVVVCYGGLNDVGNNFTNQQISNGCSSFISAAKSAFPNARIIVCGINNARHRTASVNTNAYTATKALSETCALNGVSFVPTLPWLFCEPENWATDNYHPSADGSRVLCEFMQGVIYGTPIQHLVTLTPNKVLREGTEIGSRYPATTLTYDSFSGYLSGVYQIQLYDATSPTYNINGGDETTFSLQGDTECFPVYVQFHPTVEVTRSGAGNLTTFNTAAYMQALTTQSQFAPMVRVFNFDNATHAASTFYVSFANRIF